MNIMLQASILKLNLRRLDAGLYADVRVCGECERSVLGDLGVAALRPPVDGLWLLDTGGLLYQGIEEVKIRQSFSECAARFGSEPLWYVKMDRIAFTPLEGNRVLLGFSLFGRIEQRLLRVLAEKLRDEITLSVEDADLLAGLCQDGAMTPPGVDSDVRDIRAH